MHMKINKMTNNVAENELKVEPTPLEISWFCDVPLRRSEFKLRSATFCWLATVVAVVVVVVVDGQTNEIEPLSCFTIMSNNSLHWTGIMSRLSPMIFSTDPKEADMSCWSKPVADGPHFSPRAGITHWLWATADSHNRCNKPTKFTAGVFRSNCWSWFVVDIKSSFCTRHLPWTNVENWLTHGIVLEETSFLWLVQIICIPLIVLLTFVRNQSSGHCSKQ